LATLNGENRLVAGSYNTVTGVLENVQVKFVVDGTLSLMNFPNTPVIINPIHQIWCANIISGIISPLTLDNFAQMISSAILTVNNFPILYTGYTHTNPAPFFQIIAVRNHNTLSQIRLDSPKINEDSVLLATSTELNQLNGIVIGGYAAADVVNIGGLQTLENKRLTLPKINEDVVLSATATELNQLHNATPKFRATGGSSSLNNQIMTFSSEVIDSNNNFASNTFTPTIAGKYLLMLSKVAIHKNGAEISDEGSIYIGDSFNTYLPMMTAVIVEANGTTDYFNVYCPLVSSDGSQSLAAGSVFSGFRIL
jgi:hypothetical protein